MMDRINRKLFKQGRIVIKSDELSATIEQKLIEQEMNNHGFEVEIVDTNIGVSK